MQSGVFMSLAWGSPKMVWRDVIIQGGAADVFQLYLASSRKSRAKLAPASPFCCCHYLTSEVYEVFPSWEVPCGGKLWPLSLWLEQGSRPTTDISETVLLCCWARWMFLPWVSKYHSVPTEQCQVKDVLVCLLEDWVVCWFSCTCHWRCLVVSMGLCRPGDGVEAGPGHSGCGARSSVGSAAPQWSQ